jgi:hypothetical protein
MRKKSSIHRLSIFTVVMLSLTTTLASTRQAWGGLHASIANAMEGRAPECQTKHLEFYPHGSTEYYWAWVANFEVNDKNQTTSCVMLFKAGNPKPVGSAKIPCIAEPAGGVTFTNGNATFNGGHLKCEVNLAKLLPTLAPEKGLIVEPHYDYNNILIAFAGKVAYQPMSRSNPIVVYKAAKDEAGELGMYLLTHRNSVHLMAAMNGIQVSAPAEQTLTLLAKESKLWMIHYRPEGESRARVNLSLGERQLALSRSVPPVRFHMDGGTFYIGGTPQGPHFTGTLDEVIVDPPDGGPPPGGPATTGPSGP